MNTLVTTYTDAYAYKRATTGLETDSLLGNLALLSASVSLGATSLLISPATTVDLSINDRFTIFDGVQSEVVLVTSPTLTGSTSIPCSATLAAHASATPLCSDGIIGSLADMIVDASSWLETITQQSRYATTSTETLQAPSMRAAVDRNYAIILRPRRFPIQSISALSYQTDPTNIIALNPAYAVIDSEVQSIAIPSVSLISGQQSFFQMQPIGRSSPVWIQLTYVAGYTTLPSYIVQAATCLTSALLADRQNPTGSAEVDIGQRHLVTYLRGDLSAASGLVKRAERLLRGDIERSF